MTEKTDEHESLCFKAQSSLLVFFEMNNSLWILVLAKQIKNDQNGVLKYDLAILTGTFRASA